MTGLHPDYHTRIFRLRRAWIGSSARHRSRQRAERTIEAEDQFVGHSSEPGPVSERKRRMDRILPQLQKNRASIGRPDDHFKPS